jgi:hypothetical protein
VKKEGKTAVLSFTMHEQMKGERRRTDGGKKEDKIVYRE